MLSDLVVLYLETRTNVITDLRTMRRGSSHLDRHELECHGQLKRPFKQLEMLYQMPSSQAPDVATSMEVDEEVVGGGEEEEELGTRRDPLHAC